MDDTLNPRYGNLRDTGRILACSGELRLGLRIRNWRVCGDWGVRTTLTKNTGLSVKTIRDKWYGSTLI